MFSFYGHSFDRFCRVRAVCEGLSKVQAVLECWKENISDMAGPYLNLDLEDMLSSSGDQWHQTQCAESLRSTSWFLQIEVGKTTSVKPGELLSVGVDNIDLDGQRVI